MGAGSKTIEERKSLVMRLVGARIRSHMEAAGVKVGALAKAAGVQRPDLSDMLAGVRIANADHLAKISKALLCSPNDLIPPDLAGFTLWPHSGATQHLNKMSVVGDSLSIPGSLERYLERNPAIPAPVVANTLLSVQRDARHRADHADRYWAELVRSVEAELAESGAHPSGRAKGSHATRKS